MYLYLGVVSMEHNARTLLNDSTSTTSSTAHIGLSESQTQVSIAR